MHGLLSSQAALLAVFEQCPETHVSIVQSIPSEHSASIWHWDGDDDGARLTAGVLLGREDGASLNGEEGADVGSKLTDGTAVGTPEAFPLSACKTLGNELGPLLGLPLGEEDGFADKEGALVGPWLGFAEDVRDSPVNFDGASLG